MVWSCFRFGISVHSTWKLSSKHWQRHLLVRDIENVHLIILFQDLFFKVLSIRFPYSSHPKRTVLVPGKPSWKTVCLFSFQREISFRLKKKQCYSRESNSHSTYIELRQLSRWITFSGPTFYKFHFVLSHACKYRHRHCVCCTQQQQKYVDGGAQIFAHTCEFIWNCNRETVKHNRPMISVGKILVKCYRLQSVRIIEKWVEAIFVDK